MYAVAEADEQNNPGLVQNVRIVRAPHVTASRFQLKNEGGWDNLAGMVRVNRGTYVLPHKPGSDLPTEPRKGERANFLRREFH